MSERINLLKSRLTTKYPISTGKYKIVCDSMDNSIGEPTVMRRAKVFADVLDNIKLNIMPYELIVGSACEKFMGVELESGTQPWSREELKWLQEEGYDISEKEIEETIKLNERSKQIGLDYYMSLVVMDDPQLHAFVHSGLMLPPWKKREKDAKNMSGGGGSSAGLGLSPAMELVCIDYEGVLQHGISYYIEKCKKEIAAISFTNDKAFDRAIELRSMLITLESVCRLARRYQKLALEMAETEEDPCWKQELLEIADRCSNVPDNKPRNFKEAMQMYWFLFLVINPNGVASMGRFDQFMYPFYKKDKDEGLITDEEVVDWLAAMRIKDMEFNTVGSRETRKRSAGNAKWHNMTIGGLHPDGSDASNELTLLLMDAAMLCPTPHHTLSLRVAESTPMEVIMKGVECQSRGLTMPSFISEQSYTNFYLENGVPIEIARTFALAGCVDPILPGRSHNSAGSMFVVPMTLELFLNQGIDPKNGNHVGPGNYSLDQFDTFESFYEAYKNDLTHYMKVGAQRNVVMSTTMAQMYPTPFVSALYKDGIESGKDLKDRAFDFEQTAMLNSVGMVNLGNSIYAIKKVVYDDKLCTLPELKQVLENNWEGHEDLRQYCLALPKYGNGIEDVDYFTADLYKHWQTEAVKLPAYRGHHLASAMSVTSYAPAGAITGATPDGRYKGDMFADAGISAGNGQDTNGPLALLRSAMSVPQDGLQCALFNMKFMPSSLTNDEDKKKLAAMIRTYLLNGGKQVQFNIVNKSTLEDAQIHPDDHQDLLVRVAGFSTYFISLNSQIQNEVIGRTEHEVQ